MDLRVKVIKTGVIRTVTHKAYAALGPKVYEKLGPAEESETTEPTTQVHRTVSAPVINPQIQDEPAPEPEPKAELKPPFRVENTEAVPAKVKGKPGRKLGYKKSISSKSSADEK